MNRKYAVALPVFMAASMICVSCLSAESYFRVQAAIGIKTAASTGRYSVADVARIARESGISVVITADSFLNKWRYSLWPLRGLIKKTRQANSVTIYGVKHYLEDVNAAQAANPGMVIIGGVEAAPFYYWQSFPFRSDFSIKDWHKHLLVIGLKDRADFENLPVIGNDRALFLSRGFVDIAFALFSIGMIIIGFFCLYAGRHARTDIYERYFGILLTSWRRFGIGLTIMGLALFINGYPFRTLLYDQYHGDRGALAYQNLVDYANSRAAMTFWAHPEAKNIDRIGLVGIETPEHVDSLVKVEGYTGFAIFHEGYEIAGAPGGTWDVALKEYCNGTRSAPIWAIGDLDYEQDGSLSEEMHILRTVILVRRLNREEVLKAMGEGRMYVAKDSEAANFTLDEFSITDSTGAVPAIMGQEISISGNPRIRFAGYFSGNRTRDTDILLIKNGDVIKSFSVSAPFDITYDDTSTRQPKDYYRLEVRSRGLVVIANPIFVTEKEGII